MIVVALGSNLPGTYASCDAVREAAIANIENAGIKVVSKSSVYLTAPVPASFQARCTPRQNGTTDGWLGGVEGGAAGVQFAGPESAVSCRTGPSAELSAKIAETA